MRGFALASLIVCSIVPVRSAFAQPSADAFDLDWTAPDECGDEDRLRAALSQRLGDRPIPRSEPLEASAAIERTAAGLSLTLETNQGRRQLQAATCDELIQSAAVILALLIEPEPEPEPAETPPSPAPSVSLHFYLRPELLADLGLMPSFSLGPGIALGVEIHRTLLELSGAYLPTQDPEGIGDVEDPGDLRAILVRLGGCQMFGRTPAIGPCVFLEYAHFTGRGSSEIEGNRDVDAGLWSLLAAARVSIRLGSVVSWTTELGIGLPTIEARFKVSEADDDIVHETSPVVGRVRTGLDLRF